MRDRILSTYVKDFVETYNLGELDEPTAFEHLASFCVVSKYNPENFEPGDVAVGGSGDLGLDGWLRWTPSVGQDQATIKWDSCVPPYDTKAGWSEHLLLFRSSSSSTGWPWKTSAGVR